MNTLAVLFGGFAVCGLAAATVAPDRPLVAVVAGAAGALSATWFHLKGSRP